jgi:hypothetical protein
MTAIVCGIDAIGTIQTVLRSKQAISTYPQGGTPLIQVYKLWFFIRRLFIGWIHMDAPMLVFSAQVIPQKFKLGHYHHFGRLDNSAVTWEAIRPVVWAAMPALTGAILE